MYLCHNVHCRALTAHFCTSVTRSVDSLRLARLTTHRLHLLHCAITHRVPAACAPQPCAACAPCVRSEVLQLKRRGRHALLCQISTHQHSGLQENAKKRPCTSPMNIARTHQHRFKANPRDYFCTACQNTHTESTAVSVRKNYQLNGKH